MIKILIVGASGQLGSVLTEKLQEKYGTDNVIASDLSTYKIMRAKKLVLVESSVAKMDEIFKLNA